MKVKFRDTICMGNKTYIADDVAEFTDITGQQLIDQGYAEQAGDKEDVTDKSSAAPQTAKKTTKKAE